MLKVNMQYERVAMTYWLNKMIKQLIMFKMCTK